MRGILLENDEIGASARGTNELRDGVPVLTRIDVHYTLVVPAGSREKVDRALARHVEKCPTARSLAGAVEVGWTADVRERG